MTIGQLVTRQAKCNGTGKALYYPQRQSQYTYQELSRIACQVAKGLMALGLENGEHVAVWAPNVPEWLLVQFGCAKAGTPLIAVNTNYRAYELEYVLKQSDTTTLFLTGGASLAGEFLAAIYEICPELEQDEPGRLSSERLPNLKNVVFIGQEKQSGMFSWEDFLELAVQVEDKQLADREAVIMPDDIFTLQYTSGTTGFPKGAMLTHANYLANSLAVAARQKLSAADIVCVPLPLFHAYGCIAVMSAIVSGAAVAIIESFRAADMLAAIEACQVTQVCGTPTMFIAALADFRTKSYNLSSLRGGNMSGAPCPPELVKAVIEELGASEFGVLYGSTEAIISIMNLPDSPVDERIGSIGRIMPDMSVKIVDRDTGADVMPGQQGELCIKGPSVMKGYYKMPEATTKALCGDWLQSGDLASQDDTGCYHITGRIKDVIIHGGENVYPAEVEEFLYTHPKIKDVQAVGIPCQYYGEEVIAFVILQPGQKATALELKKFCRANIALYKVPANFFFVDSFPQTASGKVQKFKLREMVAANPK